MQSFSLELYPSGQIHIALYINVKNSAELKKRLLSHDQELKYAFIDAKIVLDKFQLLVAVNNSVHYEKYSILKTHNVHSEIVYNLSPTTNISESLRRFGISDSTNDIVIVKVGGNSDEVRSHLNTLIDGEESSLDELSRFTDLNSIRKYYKIGGNVKDHEEILNMIVGSIAIKNVN